MEMENNKVCKCGNSFLMYNSLRPYCSTECEKKYKKPTNLKLKPLLKSSPRCSICKTKYTPKGNYDKTCQNVDCRVQWAMKVVEKQKEASIKKAKQQRVKEKSELKEKLMTKKDYLNKLQPIFNTFIRLRDKNQPCISCDKVLKGNDKNASHFYSVGSSPNLRFNEDNVHSSCIKCNKELHGNVLEYSLRLPNRIGVERYNQLIIDRNKPALYSIEDIKEMIFIYREKIKELK